MSLTKMLSTPTSGGKSIITPPAGHDTVTDIVGIASGLFDEVGDVFKTVENKRARKAAAERAQRQEQRSIEAAERAKASEARAAFKHEQEQANRAFQDDFARGLRNVNKSLSASKQGKVPAAQADIEMETLVSELMGKYPDMEAELLSGMRENGLDHYLIRAQKEASEAQDAETQSNLKAQQASYKFAADKGLITPDMSLEKGALIGRQFQLAEANLKETERQVQLLKTRQDISETDRKAQEKKLDGELAKTVYATSRASTQAIFGQLQFNMNGVNTDAEFAELQKSAPQALLMIDQAEMDAKSIVSGNEAAMKAVEEVYDAARRQVTDVVSGDLSHAKNTMRKLKLMEDTLGVSLHEQAPILMRANKAGLDMATIVQAIPAPMQDALRNEMLGFTSAETKAVAEAMESRTEEKDPETGKVTSAVKDITELPSATAINRAHIEKAVNANAIQILSNPNPSPVPETLVKAGKDFLDSQKQLSLLADRSANTRANMKSRKKGVEILTQPGIQAAYQKLLADPTTKDAALNQLNADRVVLHRMLQGGARHGKDFKFSQGFFSEHNAGEYDTVFNKDTGRFEAKLNVEATTKGRSLIKRALLPPLEISDQPQKIGGPRILDPTVIPRHIEDKLFVLNNSLDSLMATTEHDPEMGALVGKVSEVSMRNFYVSQDVMQLKDLTGKPFVPTNPPVKKLLPGVEGYEEQQNGFKRAEIARSTFRSPDKKIGGLLDAAAEKHNIPPAVFHAMAEAESGGQNDRNTVTSSAGAVGIMQITPIFAEEYGYDFKEMTKPSMNVEASADGFADLIEDFNGDIEDALLAYNAGPTRVRRWIKKGRPVGLKWQEEAFPYVEKIMGMVNQTPENEEEEETPNDDN